jgi:hypothetical protein
VAQQMHMGQILGINAGYNAINAYNSNFVILLVMLQQVQVVRISLVVPKEQQMLIVQISLVITLVLTQQVRLVQISWFKLWL